MIAAILAVPAWKARYLELCRQIAEEALQEDVFLARVDAYRTLLTDAVTRDPFGPDRVDFLRSLEGTETSLVDIVARRRKFLLEHESLELNSDDDDGGSADPR